MEECRWKDDNWERQEGTEAKCKKNLLLKKRKKEVMTEVFLFKGCCMLSVTSAPLANQHIPLISHFGLEHLQNIHPFHPHELKDVLMTGCTASLYSEPFAFFVAVIQ